MSRSALYRGHLVGPLRALVRDVIVGALRRGWRRGRLEVALPEPFIRTWTMYLAHSEAAFAERTLADHQLVLVRQS